MNFGIIPTPHLPTGKVCHLLCGEISKELQNSLLQHVDSLLITEAESNIERSLCNHADLSVCPLPEKQIILSKTQSNLKEKLISLGFYVIMQDVVRSPYPKDCLWLLPPKSIPDASHRSKNSNNKTRLHKMFGSTDCTQCNSDG